MDRDLNRPDKNFIPPIFTAEIDGVTYSVSADNCQVAIYPIAKRAGLCTTSMDLSEEDARRVGAAIRMSEKSSFIR